MKVRNFLEALYGYKDDQDHILIWIPNKGNQSGGNSYWHNNLDNATKFIEPFTLKAHATNVFYQVGLASKAHGPNKRCSTKEFENRHIVGLPGLFADIDVQNDVHKRPNLCKTIEEAISLVKGHGYDPTMIIDSGHGIHVFWLFKEIWELQSRQLRENAGVLLARLKKALQQISKENGNVHIDAVQDMARILRMPNTWNCKDSNLIKCKVIEYDNHIRYNPEDLEEMLPELDSTQYEAYTSGKFTEPVGKQKIKIIGLSEARHSTDYKEADFGKSLNIKPLEDGTIVLDPNPQIPHEKLGDMFHLHPRFKATWEFENNDMKDQTPSAYDMSLIMMTMHAGWNDQEITNLIIYFRQLHHNNPEKALRPDYMIGNLLRARQMIGTKEAEEVTKKIEIYNDTNYEDSISTEQIKKTIYQRHNLDIVELIEWKGDTHQYDLVLNGKDTINLRNAKELQNQNELKSKVYEKAHVVMKKVNSDGWDNTLIMFAKIMISKDVSDDHNLRGRLSDYLTEYFENSPRMTIEEAYNQKVPFVYNNSWYINFYKFKERIQNIRGERAPETNIRVELRKLRCKEETITIKEKEGSKTIRKNRRFWKIPNGALPRHVQILNLPEEKKETNIVGIDDYLINNTVNYKNEATEEKQFTSVEEKLSKDSQE